MRFFRRLVHLVALAVALGAGVAAAGPGDFHPTKDAVYDGRRATADLPPSQHKRNTGGIGPGGPGTGAGLCVYTSAWHAAIWQDCQGLFEFRKYMESQPGGSYPEKFDKTLQAYCKKKGIPVPGYVQHTGGDVAFLKLALKTGRMVCITYCGVDGPQSYGNEVIAHMVNLVYLDDQYGAILDNNFPGRLLWMPSTELVARWKGVKTDGSPFMALTRFGRRVPVGGGWAIVLLDSPPTPYPDKPAVKEGGAGEEPGCVLIEKLSIPFSDKAAIFHVPATKEQADRRIREFCGCGEGWACVCEPGCDCAPQLLVGQCGPGCCNGGGCRLIPFAPPPSMPAAPYCPDGRCPLARPQPSPASPIPGDDAEGSWLANTNGREWGYWRNGKCVAAAFSDGRCEAVNERGIATGVAIEPPAPLPFECGAAKFPRGGVDSTQLTAQESYSISGKSATKQEAHDALAATLADDSGRWNLTAVGDAAFLDAFKSAVAALPSEVRGKLHVQAYAIGSWQASQFKLAANAVTLRSPAVGRVGAELGVAPASGFTARSLAELLAKEGGPLYVAPAPAPRPKDPPADQGGKAPPKAQPATPRSQGLSDFLAFALAGAAMTLNLVARKG